MFRLTLLVCSVAVFQALATPTFYDLDKAEELFKEFIVKHNRNYENEAEKSLRYKIFIETLKEINKLKESAKTGRYGINQFSDLTNEEMEKFKGLAALNSSSSVCVYRAVPDTFAPRSFDWRDHCGVTPVKNQRTCGAGWAFATIGSVESSYLIKYKKILQLSEQQLVDCDNQNAGCSGGYPQNGAENILKVGGVMLENEYPFANHQNSECSFKPSKISVRLDGCNLYLADEEGLKRVLLQQGPLSINVASKDLKNYEGGILDHCGSNRNDHATMMHDHAMLLVGYGEENDVQFWVFKNSWGASFGENGFIKVKRGVNSCNMLADPALSTLVA